MKLIYRGVIVMGSVFTRVGHRLIVWGLSGMVGLVGCAHLPAGLPEDVQTCKPTGFEYIYADPDLDCTWIEKQADWAKKFLQANDIDPITSIYGIYVRDALSVDHNGQDVIGYSKLAHYIVLESRMLAVCHEMIHQYAYIDLSISSEDEVAHLHWDERGWMRLSGFCAEQMLSGGAP